MNKKKLISMYQRDIRHKLPNENQKEYKFILEHCNISNTFIFSEYFSFHNQLKDYKDFIIESQFAIQWLLNLSQKKESKNTFFIGGSIIRQNKNRFFNSTPIVLNGKILGFYDKQELYGKEIGVLSKGNEPLIQFNSITNKNWGLLICADVYLNDIFQKYSSADYIAIPTSSPFRPNDSIEEQHKRDNEIFIAGAKSSNTILFKCCSVGQVGKDYENNKAPRLQGRSLIASKDKILLGSPDIHWTGTFHYNEDTKDVYLHPYH